MRATILCLSAILLVALGLPASAASVLIVLDASGSMWGRIDGEPKIDIARRVVGDLVRDMPADTAIGLEAYGHNRKGDCADIEMLAAPGTDRGAVIEAMSRLTPKGKTPLTASLDAAVGELRGSEETATIVLVSDGKETCDGDPCAAAAAARASGIDVRIHVVGFDVTSEEATQLRCIAEKGGGHYYGASNAGEMVTALAEVKKEVVAEPPPPPPPAPKEPEVYLLDPFDGEDLEPHWELLNPDPDSYLVENGELLMISSAPASQAEENVPNLLKLQKEMPRGDWVATARFRMDLVTQHEWVDFGLYQDKDDFTLWGLHYQGGCCPNDRLAGHWRKASKGKVKKADLPLVGRAYAGLASIQKDFVQPVTLRITKKGRDYIGAFKLGDAADAGWKELPKVTLLRGGGNLVFGFYQAAEVTGESSLRLDEIRIDALP